MKKRKYPSELCPDCEADYALHPEIDDREYKIVKYKCPRCGVIHEMAEPIIHKPKTKV